MTREEAITLLKKLRTFHNGTYAKALDMAIEALSAETHANSRSTHERELISRADAIEAVRSAISEEWLLREAIVTDIEEIPSADAESDDLIIKGAKGIKDGLYNIKDGKLSKYYAKGGIVQAYEIVPSADAVQWWIPCSERLPKEKERVLTCDYIGHIDFGQYNKGQWYWEAEACADYWAKNDGVIAWQPLPEPYKAEE